MSRTPDTDYPDPLLGQHLQEAEKAGDRAAALSLRDSSRIMALDLMERIGEAGRQEFFRGDITTNEPGYSRLDPAGFNIQSHVFTNYVRLGSTERENELDLTHDYARIGLDISERFYRRLVASLFLGPNCLQKYPKMSEMDRLFIETFVGDAEGDRIVRDQQAAVPLPLRESAAVPDQEDVLEFRRFLGRISHAAASPDAVVKYELA